MFGNTPAPLEMSKFFPGRGFALTELDRYNMKLRVDVENGNYKTARANADAFLSIADEVQHKVEQDYPQHKQDILRAYGRATLIMGDTYVREGKFGHAVPYYVKTNQLIQKRDPGVKRGVCEGVMAYAFGILDIGINNSERNHTTAQAHLYNAIRIGQELVNFDNAHDIDYDETDTRLTSSGNAIRGMSSIALGISISRSGDQDLADAFLDQGMRLIEPYPHLSGFGHATNSDHYANFHRSGYTQAIEASNQPSTNVLIARKAKAPHLFDGVKVELLQPPSIVTTWPDGGTSDYALRTQRPY